MRDSSPSSAMRQAEQLIREACKASNPASRSDALMRAYRLGRPEVQLAFVMGLITRVAIGKVGDHS